MIKVKAASIQGYQAKSIPFHLLCQEEGSKTLAILLPGAGYTVQNPLLYYTTKILMARAYDVLQINYQYNDKQYDSFTMDELVEAIQLDVKAVIDKVITESNYENYYLVGKSLGTIAMSSELTREIFKEAKAIWLTPLLQRDDVFHAMKSSKHKGLCFIGDNDSCFIEERFHELLKNESIVSRLIPNVNHSLEYNHNLAGSIDVLKQIMEDIEQF